MTGTEYYISIVIDPFYSPQAPLPYPHRYLIHTQHFFAEPFMGLG